MVEDIYRSGYDFAGVFFLTVLTTFLTVFTLRGVSSAFTGFFFPVVAGRFRGFSTGVFGVSVFLNRFRVGESTGFGSCPANLAASFVAFFIMRLFFAPTNLVPAGFVGAAAFVRLTFLLVGGGDVFLRTGMSSRRSD